MRNDLHPCAPHHNTGGVPAAANQIPEWHSAANNFRDMHACRGSSPSFNHGINDIQTIIDKLIYAFSYEEIVRRQVAIFSGVGDAGGRTRPVHERRGNIAPYTALWAMQAPVQSFVTCAEKKVEWTTKRKTAT